MLLVGKNWVTFLSTFTIKIILALRIIAAGNGYFAILLMAKISKI